MLGSLPCPRPLALLNLIKSFLMRFSPFLTSVMRPNEESGGIFNMPLPVPARCQLRVGAASLTPIATEMCEREWTSPCMPNCRQIGCHFCKIRQNKLVSFPIMNPRWEHHLEILPGCLSLPSPPTHALSLPLSTSLSLSLWGLAGAFSASRVASRLTSTKNEGNGQRDVVDRGSDNKKC